VAVVENLLRRTAVQQPSAAKLETLLADRWLSRRQEIRLGSQGFSNDRSLKESKEALSSPKPRDRRERVSIRKGLEWHSSTATKIIDIQIR